MPCYDKKLEASRQDFYNDVYATRDVDCVLTTGELELMALEKDYDLTVPVPQDVSDGAPFPELLTTPGSSSGSYLQTLVDTFSGPNTKVDINTNRTDYEEVLVKEVSSGRTLFRGAKCYGFRNLQNLVRKIGKDAGLQTTKGAAGRLVGRTTRKAPRKVEEKGYDYVEVMACPSGCVNGGGQLGRPATELQENDGIPTTRWGDKAWVEQVEASYWGDDAPDVRQWEAANALAAQILAEVCLPTDMRDEQGWNEVMDEAAEERRRAYFRTSYRKVEGDVIGLAVKW
jgi:iron only hydrogenase large subunit-like protein